VFTVVAGMMERRRKKEGRRREDGKISEQIDR
jgi:hypothetical protein